MIVCGLTMIGFFMAVGITENQLTTATVKGSRTEVVKVYPDMLNTNGDRFNLVAVSSVTHRKAVYYGQFKSSDQKQQLLASTKPVLVKMIGDFGSFSVATNVNQFDVGHYYHHQKIAQVFTASNIVSIIPKTQLSMVDRIHVVRSSFNRYCQKLPNVLRMYAMGLISGTRQNDFFNEMTGVKQLGLLHAFSISGMHVTYFLIIINQLMNLVGLGKFKQAFIELICLVGYFVFAGASAGVLRAVMMAAIGIVNKLFKCHLTQLDLWSLTLIINLFLYPEAMLLMGVQLSYALSFGLIVSTNLSYVKQTVLLNLLTVPILLFHIYEWHFLSVVVNLIVLPLFGKAIFPLVFVGLGMGLLNPDFAAPVEFVLRLFNDALNLIGALPGMIVFGKPCLLVILIMLLLTLLLILKTGRVKAIILTALISVYLAAFWWIHFPINGEVTMFDVGQGDSFLIRKPFNRSVTLIDTGGRVQFGQEDWQRGTLNYQATRIAINYLKSIGISRIDNLCVSHQDADHCGDLPAYISEMEIKRIIIPLGMDKNTSFMARISDRDASTKVIPVNDEMKVRELPFLILHPYSSGRGENHDSMVLSCQIGGLRWLFTGDLDRQGELDTLNRHPGLSTDFLKVGHHGSRTASDPRFISQLHPKIALISAGRNNRYHHPNQETLVTLAQAHISVANTQTMGMVRYIYCGNKGHFESVQGGNEGKMK